ncbi:MAG: hypothetical protein KDD60_13200 [Bdellovibrionales bacterium]|nr:hypothetical protein [Bdellovibrionales bacterium]
MEVVGGPLAFAISLNIAGATREGEFKPPMPTEWNLAVEKKGGQVRIPEGIIDLIWDDAASPKKPKAEQGGAH